MELYKKQPINYNDNIPIFCKTNEYIQNYDYIAQTHLKSIAIGNGNPWDNCYITNFMNESFAKYIKQYTIETSDVLDAGVALGEIFDYVNVNKYGVDISIDYLRITQNKNINVCLAMLEDLPYNDSIFDMVLCKNVLEHVLDLNAVIKEFDRILKPNGYILLQVPYNQSLKDYVTSTEFKYVHLWRFDEWDLMMLFGKIFKFKYIAHEILNDYGVSIINILFQK